MTPETSLIASTTPSKHELTDLLTEGINAVIETQESYAKDWTQNLHRKAWEAEHQTRTA